MRFNVTMECTPEEARSFFGLPDVQPMQTAIMQQLQEQMMSNIRAMEPDAMMRQWLPMSMQAFDNFQKMFWSQMGSAQNSEMDMQKKRG